jgi:hypothetical protein
MREDEAPPGPFRLDVDHHVESATNERSLQADPDPGLGILGAEVLLDVPEAVLERSSVGVGGHHLCSRGGGVSGDEEVIGARGPRPHREPYAGVQGSRRSRPPVTVSPREGYRSETIGRLSAFRARKGKLGQRRKTRRRRVVRWNQPILATRALIPAGHAYERGRVRRQVEGQP